ncbi:uracil phosphoribosyltransferase [Lacinutrix neustonica]|uniref:Uracil phosphoribosyltransferase n=1 Tax=Lacinutrix neustonica TaxID=2980107 RepID=A0A9E8MTB6_9FLAO|nr:uracil phosphoribosyltransferase [Lacinutrix neustonica]WAC01102.1 uracil phosphoribosyltransferase [Lacinutrix neustonica]
MTIHNISENDSILNTFLAEIRDTVIQKDSMRFRRNIERIGEVLAYEMSKSFDYKSKTVETPLAKTEVQIQENDMVLCSILRAGLPLHNGLINYFDKAENAFISAYRHHLKNPETFEIIVEYLACPNLKGKTLILADPMVATGQSLLATFEALKPFGTPKEIHLVAVIGAQEGLDFIKKHFPKNTTLWIGAVDKDLNSKGYIVPGLGDAGDLAFGEKLQH